ncbi:MAG: type II toxin-antitoxin system antitoxin SocA domain-containing protein [Candidatus Paceibacterota bacterium]
MSSQTKSIKVAEYFVKKNEEDQKGLDPKKIQKLVYYAQAWNLVVNGEKLYSDRIKAWIHGPAIPRVWHAFKEFNFYASHPEFLEKDFSVFTDEEKRVLEAVWEIYGKYDGNYLEALTHEELPWQEARRDVSPSEASSNTISTALMQRYYGQRLQEAK